MKISKLGTLLGFAIKSGKIVFGFDNLCETRKNVKLVLFSPSTNDKIEVKIKKLCEYKNWTAVKLQEEIADLIGRENCKVVGVIDENLSKEMLKMENINLVNKGVL